MNAFEHGLDTTMCDLSANISSDKATNGQADIKCDCPFVDVSKATFGLKFAH